LNIITHAREYRNKKGGRKQQSISTIYLHEHNILRGRDYFESENNTGLRVATAESYKQ
jgi:hypothetical protein